MFSLWNEETLKKTCDVGAVSELLMRDKKTQETEGIQIRFEIK